MSFRDNKNDDKIDNENYKINDKINCNGNHLKHDYKKDNKIND